MRFSLFSAAVALALAHAAAPAAAIEGGTPLSPEAFEAFAEGQTLTFSLGGAPYGMEEYLPGRRVIWAFVGEECREGVWFPHGPQICFEYNDEPGRLHCWTFYQMPDGLLARSDGMGDSAFVRVERSSEPMFCPGPEVGA